MSLTLPNMPCIAWPHMQRDCLTGSAHESPIWQMIAAYQIGPASATLAFDRRLARENGWSSSHAERVIEEYRRFCFLAVSSGHPVTPSDAVDQVWHLHLTYTRDYWERFCPDVLGHALHHSPTTGGPDEQHRFFQQYAATLHSYEQIFGHTAPPDIWPSAAKRLIDDPRARRVHPRDGILVPAWLGAMAMMLAAAAGFSLSLFF